MLHFILVSRIHGNNGALRVALNTFLFEVRFRTDFSCDKQPLKQALPLKASVNRKR